MEKIIYDPEKIGRNIKAARSKKGFNQTQLAEAVNLSVPTVCNIEQGKTSMKLLTVIEIANELNVTLDDLIN